MKSFAFTRVFLAVAISVVQLETPVGDSPGYLCRSILGHGKGNSLFKFGHTFFIEFTFKAINYITIDFQILYQNHFNNYQFKCCTYEGM